MPMSRHHGLLRAASLAVVVATLVAGCGGAPDRDAPSGTTVVQSGVAYSVQTSRELNPAEPDDRALLDGVRRVGRLDGPDSTLLGVFLQATDQTQDPRRAVAAPQLVDAFGRVFRPLHLPAGDPSIYRGGRLAPGQQIPNPDSNAAQGPENGAALVYRVPTDVFLTDRPFTLRFGPGARAASVQLDI
jgi:hypothetical protein